MTDRRHPSRRRFIGSASAFALAPLAAPLAAPARAQTPPPFAEFAARCRALSGFDVLPRALLADVARLLDDLQKRALVGESHASGDLEKEVLLMLYTGMHRPDDGPLNRFAYADALMFATVEDSLNVPSYCGGLPGYWARKPQTA